MVGTVIYLSTPSNDDPPRTGVAGGVRVHLFSIIAARLLRQARLTVVEIRAVVAVRIRHAASNALQRAFEVTRQLAHADADRGELVGAVRFELTTPSTPC